MFTSNLIPVISKNLVFLIDITIKILFGCNISIHAQAILSLIRSLDQKFHAVKIYYHDVLNIPWSYISTIR